MAFNIQFNRIILTLLLLAFAGLFGVGCSKESKKARYLARAEKYFAAADYEKAAIEYRNVLRYEPTNNHVIFRIARILCEQGSPLRAFEGLQDYGLTPEDPLLRTRMAELHLSSGERALARNELVAVLSRYPTNTEALLVLPSTAATKEEISDIGARLQKLAEQYPRSPGVSLARASLCLLQKDLVGGEQLCQRALQLAPALPEAHLQMAQIQLLRKNFPAAEQSFATAARNAPIRSPFRLAYARAKAVTGKTDETRTILNEIIKKAPDYLPASLLLARVELQESKPQAALATLEHVLSRDPLNLEAWQVRSQAMLANGQAKEAAQEWEHFDAHIRPNALTKLLVARSLLASGAIVKADAFLAQAIQLSSNRLDGVAVQARLLKASLNLHQNPELSIDPLQQLLNKTNLLQAKLLLADAYRNAHRTNEAIAICRALAKENPQNPRFHYLLGEVLGQAAQFREARIAFQQSLELAPGSLLVLSSLVDLDIALSNYPAALRLLQAEAPKNTNTAALAFFEGRVYAAQRQWPQAEASLKRSLQMDPNFYSAYQLLSAVYVANKNLNSAAKELEAGIAKRTNDVQSLIMLALVREQMKEYPRAAETYEKVLAIVPDQIQVINTFAYLCSERLNNLKKAAELARRARLLNPEDPQVADTLGWILHKQGDNQGALPLLREAAEQFPNNPEVHYHLGITSYMLGLEEPAKLALQKALSSPGPFTGRDQAQACLARLTSSAGTSLSQAVAELEKLLQKEPEDIALRMRLAGLLEQNASHQKAAREYEEVLRQNPRDPQATLRLALLNAGPLNNRASARELARKARDLSPNDPGAAALLGRLVFQEGDHAQAYNLLLLAAQQVPKRADVHYDLAWAAWSLGRIGEADQSLRHCLQLDAAFKEADAARSFAAMTALQLNPKALPQSESQIQQLLQADPNHAPALLCKAMLLRARGQGKEAAPLLEKVLTAFPTLTPAKRELALIYAADPTQAQKAYEFLMKTREVYKDDPDIARALGLASYQRKDHSYAITLLETCLRVRPNDPEAIYYLGMSFCQTKDLAKGREQLQKAISAGLKEPLLTEAKRILQLGGSAM